MDMKQSCRRLDEVGSPTSASRASVSVAGVVCSMAWRVAV
jgi:hypothetical protein